MSRHPLIGRLVRSAAAFVFVAAVPLQATDKPTSVAVQMKRIAEDFKALTTLAAEPSQKEAALTRVESIREAITLSRPLIPSPALGLEGSELRDYLATFRLGLDEFDTSLEKLSQAIQLGEPHPITTAIAEMNRLKKTYHSDLR